MVDYKKVEHIIDRQAKAEEEFLAEFRAGNYTINNPLVKLNPYLITPLTAVILFKTPIRTEATITVLGKEAAGNITHTFPAAKEHILPIYGLYADYANKVEIVLASGEKTVVTIQTDVLEEDVPKSTYIKTTPEYFGNNLMFLTAAMHAMPVGYDYQGEVRWHANLNFAFDLKRISNGHFLIGTERLVKMPYFTTGLYEMAMSGKIFKEYVIPCGGYHHDQFEMPDGNILALTFDFYSGTVEDVCVLLDKNTGEILNKWDYKEVLPQYPTAGSGSQDAHDWFHNNAVWYDQRTNTLTFSGRHQDAVINIDYEHDENGKCKLNWIIGDPTGWPEDMQKYFFKPVGDGEFDWQYEQHACVILPDGDVMMFDNGHYRSKVKENYIPNSKNFSRGVRYRIDTEKMEIRQIWQYGKERGAEFFSPYICNVEYYDEGHYLVHSGGIGYEDGKTCEGMAVMLSMQPNNPHKYDFNSITCELKDDVLMYELHVPANCYRAEKLPVYYANETIELGKGQYLGGLIVTKQEKMKISAKDNGAELPARFKCHITEEKDRINVNAFFEENTINQVLLYAEDGSVIRYHIDTAPANFLAMCVGTFQKADSREIDTFINKTNLHGKYEVKVLAQLGEEEFEIYKTGVTIEA